MLDNRPSAVVNWRYKNKMDIKPSAEIKKCLFGKPEPETLQTELDQQLGELQAADRQRWNYDFKKDLPLIGGRYKWEKLSFDLNQNTNTMSDEEAKLDNIGLRCGDALDKSADSDSSPCTSPTSPTKVQLTKSTLPAQSPSTQRCIAEFFPQRKRGSPSVEESRSKRMRSDGMRNTTDKPVVSRSLHSTFSPIAKAASTTRTNQS